MKEAHEEGSLWARAAQLRNRSTVDTLWKRIVRDSWGLGLVGFRV